MKIGGLQKCSLIDYPGEISAVVFTAGCNFRCCYCYNSELVVPEKYPPVIPGEEILSFLEKRKGKLDAVVLTGGEPCTQEALPGFIRRVKEMGFKVKLDTNGSCPGVVEKVLPSVDYIAMDVKAPMDRYAEIAGVSLRPGKIRESIRLLMESGKDYEFRTTVCGGLFSRVDFEKIGSEVNGAERHYIQNFMASEKVLTPGIESCPGEELEIFRSVLSGFVGKCAVR